MRVRDQDSCDYDCHDRVIPTCRVHSGTLSLRITQLSPSWASITPQSL
jgi:hypothetical protein